MADVPYYYYGGEEDDPGIEGEIRYKPIVELKEGLSKPLVQVIARLNLLGHTYCGFDTSRFTFRHLRDAPANVDVSTVSADYGEGGEDFGKFFVRKLAPRLGLIKHLEDDPVEHAAVSFGVGHGLFPRLHGMGGAGRKYRLRYFCLRGLDAGQFERMRALG
ncbi:hypothetical protein [Mesorhizobium waimense]|uniref:hypothetical protein n=1 Tax=Mesorhizobium waimense TaxID=1300307 RepID=UPI0011C3C7A4|nr:hypothetical protein [Mesorhizobium waimense]